MAARERRARDGRAQFGSAANLIPPHPTLAKLRAIAAACRECDLWTKGTQTVFGEGPKQAQLMFVGEQPGDREDRAGEPFVGPSGRLLDEALERAGVARDDVYVTNVVKHFNWERRGAGKRRIHKKPNDREIRACFPWLAAEIALVQPRVIVALGATAAQALLGKAFRVTKSRGKAVASEWGAGVVATVHPSSVLRTPGEEAREKARAQFFRDIAAAVRNGERRARRSALGARRTAAVGAERRVRR